MQTDVRAAKGMSRTRSLARSVADNHLLGRPDCADRIEAAVATVLGAGAGTRDLVGTSATLDTRGMGHAIAELV